MKHSTELAHMFRVFAIAIALLSQTFSVVLVSGKIKETKIRGSITESTSPTSFEVDVKARYETVASDSDKTARPGNPHADTDIHSAV